MKNIPRRSVCWLWILGFGVMAQAGVVIQQESNDIGGEQGKQKVTLSIDSGKIRVDNQGADQKNSTMIFDGDKQVMWIIRPDEGSYREMTAAQVQQMGAQMGQMGGQMSQMMQQMQAQMAQMPPEQRKKMEEMMKQRMGGAGAAAAVTIQEKGSEKVGAYNTTHYQLSSNGQTTEEIWAASPDQLHVDPSDFKAFEEMAKFFEPLRRNLPKGAWSAPDMQQIKGIPVRSVSYDNGKPVTEWLLKSVEEKRIDASQFTVPANLKKMEMMPAMGGPGMSGMGRGR